MTRPVKFSFYALFALPSVFFLICFPLLFSFVSNSGKLLQKTPNVEKAFDEYALSHSQTYDWFHKKVRIKVDDIKKVKSSPDKRHTKKAQRK